MRARAICFYAALVVGMFSTAHAETLDGTFSGDGRVVDYDSTRDYKSVAAFTQANGDVVRVFTYTGSCGACIALVRSSATGGLIQSRSLDAGLMSVVAAAQDQNGRIVVVGSTNPSGIISNMGVVRLNRDLSNDLSFAGDGGMSVSSTYTEVPTAVAIDRNNNIVVVGRRFWSASDTDFTIARVIQNGTLDTTFAGGGVRTVAFDLGNTEQYDEARAVAIGNDGKIVVVGTAYDSTVERERVAIARINHSGSLDSSLCNPGCAFTLYPAINSGRTVYHFGNSSGHADIAAAVDTTSDGGFVVAGTTFQDSSGLNNGAVARLGVNGGFVSERIVPTTRELTAVQVVEGATTRIYAAGVNNNQSLLMVQALDSALGPISNYGSCGASFSAVCFSIIEGLSDGRPALDTSSDSPVDPAFSDDPLRGTVSDYGPDAVSALSIDPLGRPLLSGHGYPGQFSARYMVTARLTNSNGPKPDVIFRHGFQ